LASEPAGTLEFQLELASHEEYGKMSTYLRKTEAMEVPNSIAEMQVKDVIDAYNSNKDCW
jgi:hypothetical protein